MSSFSVTGLISGINYPELISKILEVQRRPIQIWESKKTVLDQKINAYNDIASKLDSLKSAADALKDPSDFEDKIVNVSDTAVLTATASSSATVGVWNVSSITQLATAHKIRSTNTVSSYTSAIGLDSADPDYGTDDTFKFSYKGVTYSVNVDSSTTLESLKNSINALDAGVQASILNVGTESSPAYTLLLTAEDTGSNNTISIVNDVTLLDMENDGAGGGVTTLSSALDATFTIDGITFTRSTNTITDVIPGVTLNLLKTSTSNVSVQIARDTSAIKEKIKNFVNAYNDVVSFISEKSAYDAVTREAQILSGESTARGIEQRLRSIITSRVSGLPEDLRILAQIGITTSNDGTLSIDEAKLDDKLSSNLDGVADLFTSTHNGIAKQVYDYVTRVTSTVDGAVTLRKEGLQKIIDRLDKNIERVEERLSRLEEDLMRRYAELERMLAGLNIQGDFLTNQAAMLLSI